jgi:hypothetical protein
MEVVMGQLLMGHELMEEVIVGESVCVGSDCGGRPEGLWGRFGFLGKIL